MYLQPARQANPYAAYQALLQRGLMGDRTRELNQPELRLGAVSAPSVRAQLLANAERYDRLGNALTGVLPALGALATPLPTLGRRLVAAKAAPGALEDGPTPAQAATLRGDVALSLRVGTPAATASMTSARPTLRHDTATPATAATLTLGKVSLDADRMVKAQLRGDNLRLPKKGAADFGAITINGVTTTLGVVSAPDEQTAAQAIADRINANRDNTVLAAVDPNGKRLTLTAKVPGTAGNITIDRVTSDSDGNAKNDTSAGFGTGDRADGQDGGSSDFGSVTINGVTTTFGTRNNGQQTPQTATQWLVDKLNANSANAFTASVGGADGDQVVLTSRTQGALSRLLVDQVDPDSDGDSTNAAVSGFVAGLEARGSAGDPGVTDLGAITINGVTTTFGVVSNELSSRGAARTMVERLNANASNPVVASLGGDDLDQVVLTAKAPGSAGTFRIERATSDSNGRAEDDGFNGWVAGREARGADATSGLTDFGALTINGVTTRFGALDGRVHTPQSALQYLLDRLNATNPTLTAHAEDGRIVLRSRETGRAAAVSIEGVEPDSDGDPGNAQGLGFSVGRSAQGEDARPAKASAPHGAETVYERIVDGSQIQGQLEKAGRFAQDLTQYLRHLKESSQDLPRSVKGFGAELARTLSGEAETLTRLGLRVEDDRIEVDAATLAEALRADPQGTAEGFKRLQGALEATVGAQAFALDQMRSVSQSTGETAETMSQVAASLYKIQHRAKRLSWLMEQVAPAEDALKQQRERLQKLAEDKRDDQQAPKKADEAKQKDPTSAPIAGREPERFGLLRSPVPEGFNPGPNPGPGARWPFER